MDWFKANKRIDNNYSNGTCYFIQDALTNNHNSI